MTEQERLIALAASLETQVREVFEKFLKDVKSPAVLKVINQYLEVSMML